MIPPRILTGNLMQFLKQSLPLIPHTIKPTHQQLIIFNSFLSIFIFINTYILTTLIILWNINIYSFLCCTISTTCTCYYLSIFK